MHKNYCRIISFVLFTIGALSLSAAKVLANGESYSEAAGPIKKNAIIFNTGEYSNIEGMVLQYKEDVEARFPVDLSIVTGDWETPQQLRNTVIDLYADGIEGVIFAGTLPYAKWKFSWDETCPLPFYFEDLDGSFIDTDNDGFFDYHTWGINDGPEIWVSYILPPVSIDTSAALAHYFAKTHLYYSGALYYEKRALVYVAHDWYSAVHEMVDELEPIFGDAIDSYGGKDFYTSGSEYQTILSDNSYAVVDVWSHASSAFHQFDQAPLQNLFARSIYDFNSTGLITMIWGCHGGDFVENPINCLPISYLFGNSQGLASCASTRSIGIEKHEMMYQAMAEGRSLGEGYFEWKQYCCNTTHVKKRFPTDDLNNFMWGWVLMGNPYMNFKDYGNKIADLNEDAVVNVADLETMAGLWMTTVMDTINEGLVGYWSFDEGEGDLVHDGTDSGNDGSVSGAEFVEGLSGTALNFDGENDYVNINLNIEPTEMPVITITAWIKPDRTDGRRTIFSNDSGKFGRTLTIDSRAGGNVAVFNGIWAYGVAQPSTTEWTFAAATYNRNKVILWTNDAKRTVSDYVSSGVSISRIGANPALGDYYSGKIDEVRVYDRQLHDIEIEFLRKNPGYAAFKAESADLNYDTYINMLDFSILAGQWLNLTDPGATAE